MRRPAQDRGEVVATFTASDVQGHDRRLHGDAPCRPLSPGRLISHGTPRLPRKIPSNAFRMLRIRMPRRYGGTFTSSNFPHQGNAS